MSDRFYGIFDPLIESTEHIANCAKCRCGDLFCCFEIPDPQQLPGIISKKDIAIAKKAYFVKCAHCGSRGLACKKDWQAVIEWNKSPLSVKFHYQEFPIFGLKNLSKTEAKERLVEIRSDLEQRKKEKIVNKDRLYNQHYERIRAFLAWAIYAQTIIKLSPEDNQATTDSQNQQPVEPPPLAQEPLNQGAPVQEPAVQEAVVQEPVVQKPIDRESVDQDVISSYPEPLPRS